ncbi:hypothetical protein L7F22_020584 [Adiantum nelumboides]|nr:hypothetical protein [Adiantum nelumboides]
MLNKTLRYRTPILGQQWRLTVNCDKGELLARAPDLGSRAPVACHQAAAVKGEDISQEMQDSCTHILRAGVNKSLRGSGLWQPDFEDIQHLLQCCKKKGDQVLAWKLTIYLCELGLEAHRLLGNYLVSVLCYVISGNPMRALTLYQDLEKDSAISVSGYAFVSLLNACTKLKDAVRGFERDIAHIPNILNEDARERKEWWENYPSIMQRFMQMHGKKLQNDPLIRQRRTSMLQGAPMFSFSPPSHTTSSLNLEKLEEDEQEAIKEEFSAVAPRQGF